MQTQMEAFSVNIKLTADQVSLIIMRTQPQKCRL